MAEVKERGIAFSHLGNCLLKRSGIHHKIKKLPTARELDHQQDAVLEGAVGLGVLELELHVGEAEDIGVTDGCHRFDFAPVLVCLTLGSRALWNRGPELVCGGEDAQTK